MRRLKVERIDLYQLHRIDPKVPAAESLGALVDMQRAGKIRHIGVSQISVAEYEQCKKLAQIVSVQNLFNVEDRSSSDVVDACERDRNAFLPWYPRWVGRAIPSTQKWSASRRRGVYQPIASRSRGCSRARLQ